MKLSIETTNQKHTSCKKAWGSRHRHCRNHACMAASIQICNHVFVYKWKAWRQMESWSQNRQRITCCWHHPESFCSAEGIGAKIQYETSHAPVGIRGGGNEGANPVYDKMRMSSPNRYSVPRPAWHVGPEIPPAGKL